MDGHQTLNRKPRFGERVPWTEQIYVPASPEHVATVRQRVTSLLRAAGFSPSEVIDVAVAVSEALSNAIEHAGPYAAEPTVKVECELDPEKAHIVVRDRGQKPWDPADTPPEADPMLEWDDLSHHGRGLQFMRALTDEFSIGHRGDGTEVHLIKRRRPNGLHSTA